MTYVLFIAACAMSSWLGWRVRKAYLDMHNVRLGNWTVGVFFNRVYAFIARTVFVPAMSVLSIVDFTNEGEISDAWCLAVAVAFTLLGIFATIFVMVIEALVGERMLQPQAGEAELPADRDMFLHDPRR